MSRQIRAEGEELDKVNSTIENITMRIENAQWEADNAEGILA